jgi:hypothetical protein
MNPTAIKNLIILVLCGITAIVLGSIVSSQSYDNLLLLTYLLVGIYVVAAPGFVPLIAFGLLNPFILPIPFIWNVPFMLLILAICCVKLFFYKAISKEQFTYRNCFTWATIAFFAWVVLRYGLNPVRPNTSGFGANVTGFRSYLNYAICGALVLFIPFFFRKREDVVKLVRWIGGLSVFFILFFLPFAFSKSMFAANWLQRFGLFVATFDNGLLRFVVLPGFGLNLLILSMLPNLVTVRKWMRVSMAGLGITAIVLGGNRGSFIMAGIMVAAILLIQGRRMMVGVSLAAAIMMLGAFHYIGEQLDIREGVGFLRILSIGSERVARESGAMDTVEWRMIRWKRAMNEIEAHPLVGKGYGGLENAWIWSDWAQFEEARVEVDLAAGGIHNGYITAAYSLGIPALLFFVIALGGQLVANIKAVRRSSGHDPALADLHTYIYANLVGLIPSIYIGTDLNAPTIWLYIALGVLLTRMSAEKVAEPETVATPEVVPYFPKRIPV